MVDGCRLLTCVLLLYFLGFKLLPGWKIVWNCLPEGSLGDHATSDLVKEKNLPTYQLQQLAKRIRHLVSALRGSKYFASRICYYANSDSTFHHARLLTSGNVSLNPGPIINSSRCSVCMKKVARNHRALSCDQCELWCHMKCGQVKLSQYKHYQQKDYFNWNCPTCF